MQAGSIYKVRTDKDDQFTTEVVQNAIDTESVNLAPEIGAGAHSRARIRSLAVISDQNLSWEIQFYGTDAFNDADVDLFRLLGRFLFQTSDGTQIAAAGPYVYYVDGLDIPYEDFDFQDHRMTIQPPNVPAPPQPQLHIALVNRSATSKNAGATGEITIEVGMEITQGI